MVYLKSKTSTSFYLYSFHINQKRFEPTISLTSTLLNKLLLHYLAMSKKKRLARAAETAI